MRPALAVCTHCRGSGRIAISHPYYDTLCKVPGWWASTDTIHDQHPRHSVKRTALINRLNKLVAYRLVERDGTGRNILWRRT